MVEQYAQRHVVSVTRRVMCGTPDAIAALLHSIGKARSLYAHAREPKELIVLPTAHHLDWIQPGDPIYVGTVPRIVAWLGRQLTS